MSISTHSDFLYAINHFSVCEDCGKFAIPEDAGFWQVDTLGQPPKRPRSPDIPTDEKSEPVSKRRDVDMDVFMASYISELKRKFARPEDHTSVHLHKLGELKYQPLPIFEFSVADLKTLKVYYNGANAVVVGNLTERVIYKISVFSKISSGLIPYEADQQEVEACEMLNANCTDGERELFHTFNSVSFLDGAQVPLDIRIGNDIARLLYTVGLSETDISSVVFLIARSEMLYIEENNYDGVAETVLKNVRAVINSESYLPSNRNKDAMPLSVFKLIATQVCKAVKKLHDLGYAHCDISLGNVLFRYYNNAFLPTGRVDVKNVRLVDFQHLTKLGEIQSAHTIFYTDIKLATLNTSKLRASRERDIYALGILLFHWFFYMLPSDNLRAFVGSAKPGIKFYYSSIFSFIYHISQDVPTLEHPHTIDSKTVESVLKIIRRCCGIFGEATATDASDSSSGTVPSNFWAFNLGPVQLSVKRGVSTSSGGANETYRKRYTNVDELIEDIKNLPEQ